MIETSNRLISREYDGYGIYLISVSLVCTRSFLQYVVSRYREKRFSYDWSELDASPGLLSLSFCLIVNSTYLRINYLANEEQLKKIIPL